MITIYKITNRVNGKIYVGQTACFSNRRLQHLETAKNGSQRPLYRAIRKHGNDNFVFEVLEECRQIDADEREKHWIASFQSFNSEFGYNLTTGGRSTYKIRDSVRLSIPRRPWNRGLKLSTEYRHKLSVAHLGKPAPWNKRPRTDIEKEHLRQVLTGRKHTTEEIQRQINAQRGKKFSEARRNSLRKPKSDVGKANMQSARRQRQEREHAWVLEFLDVTKNVHEIAKLSQTNVRRVKRAVLFQQQKRQ